MAQPTTVRHVEIKGQVIIPCFVTKLYILQIFLLSKGTKEIGRRIACVSRDGHVIFINQFLLHQYEINYWTKVQSSHRTDNPHLLGKQPTLQSS